jgi:hypothetical protein
VRLSVGELRDGECVMLRERETMARVSRLYSCESFKFAIGVVHALPP